VIPDQDDVLEPVHYHRVHDRFVHGADTNFPGGPRFQAILDSSGYPREKRRYRRDQRVPQLAGDRRPHNASHGRVSPEDRMRPTLLGPAVCK